MTNFFCMNIIQNIINIFFFFIKKVFIGSKFISESSGNEGFFFKGNVLLFIFNIGVLFTFKFKFLSFTNSIFDKDGELDKESLFLDALKCLQIVALLPQCSKNVLDLESLYKNVLTEIKNIYDKTTEEIDQRKSDLMDRIMLSIANCDYKHAQLLEMKIKEQEELFRQLHMFTFEMQQVIDNYENSVKKIKILSEENYDLRKIIFQEKLKFQHITSLMKEFKIRTNFMANKINNYIDI